MTPRFTIITPCLNAATYIEETVVSVLQQTAVLRGMVELEYIVSDGGSTDGTLDVLSRLKHPFLQVYSERDQGMYDALSKGLLRATGHYVAYLNAGDYYHKCAFEVVAELFGRYHEVRWLTGLYTVYNEYSQITMVESPFRFRRAFFANAFHGSRVAGVQQESTFWRASLLELIDYEQLKALRLAGDFYLWQQFAQHHDLYIVAALLGGFKRHPGQQSEGGAYLRELLSLGRPARPLEKWLAFWDNLISRYTSDKVKRRLNSRKHFLYDFSTRQWCQFLERSKR